MEVMIVSCEAPLKYVAVCYRGTESKRDAIVDSKIIMRSFAPKEENADEMPFSVPDGVEVHRGFNSAFFHCNLHTQVSNALDKVLEENPDKKLVFTGHSLGAAVSTLAAVYTAMRLPDREVLNVNFGSPRVGNANFKEWVESIENLAIWRVVHEDDIVPRVPPSIFGYRHVGHLVDIDHKQGGEAFYRHIGDATRGFIGAEETEWNVNPDSNAVDSVQDHGTVAYIGYLTEKGPLKPRFFPTRFQTAEDEALEYTSDPDEPPKRLRHRIARWLSRWK